MEKIKLLLYCTKSKPNLIRIGNNPRHLLNLDKNPYDIHPDTTLLNGKIVAECDYEVEHLYNAYSPYRESDIHYFDTDTLNEAELIKRSCVSNLELENYFKDKNGYAIHIKNLKERIMELSDVYKHDNSYDNMFGWIVEEDEKYIPLDKAPQNMCKVWVKENGEWVMYILISVRPEWLCLELNGEKTIEFRKIFLKEMVK